MFTGLVQSLGRLADIAKNDNLAKIYIESEFLVTNTALGDSVSCNGVCLTVADYLLESNLVGFDVMDETLQNSNLNFLKINDLINLELAMLPTTRFGGHFVSGHVDFYTELLEISSNKFIFAANSNFDKYISSKGSITINGVSLTVVDANSEFFSVCLIPKTLQDTVFGSLKVHDKVNIEVDLVARYIEKLLIKS